MKELTMIDDDDDNDDDDDSWIFGNKVHGAGFRGGVCSFMRFIRGRQCQKAALLGTGREMFNVLPGSNGPRQEDAGAASRDLSGGENHRVNGSQHDHRRADDGPGDYVHCSVVWGAIWRWCIW